MKRLVISCLLTVVCLFACGSGGGSSDDSPSCKLFPSVESCFAEGGTYAGAVIDGETGQVVGYTCINSNESPECLK